MEDLFNQMYQAVQDPNQVPLPGTLEDLLHLPVTTSPDQVMSDLSTDQSINKGTKEQDEETVDKWLTPATVWLSIQQEDKDTATAT